MGHKYPYTGGDRFVGVYLDNALEASAGPTPPSGGLGGAGQYKQWVDTSTTPPTMRLCAVPRASVNYVAAEWMTIGYFDLAAHDFNYNVGKYIYFDGATGTVNTAGGGPYIYADTASGNMVIKLGANNAGFTVQAYNGTVNVLDVLSNGVLMLNGINFAATDTGNTVLYDFAGGQALLLGNGETVYKNDTHLFANRANNLQLAIMDSSGNFHIGGTYFYFNNSSGVVNGTGGPLIFADNTNAVLKLGSGNGGFSVQPYGSAVNVIEVLASGVVQVNGINFLGTDTTGFYNIVYNYNNQQALYLGPSGNHYRGSQHVFESMDGSVNMFDITASGDITVNRNAAVGNVLTVNGFGVAISAPNGTITAGDTLHAVNKVNADGTGNAINANNGNIVAGGSMTAGGTGTAISAPNGNMSCQNLTAINDVTATGVFRRSPGGAGARIECFGGSWGYMTFGINAGSLTVSPDNGVSGFIFGPGTGFSDARLKDNIRDSEIDALEMLRQTPVRAFEWNDKARELMPWVTSVECGLVAQELEETIPIAVSTTDLGGGTKYISDQYLTPYFIRAIQQLADRLDAGGL
jgi:Chaperone of endosialidase